jgi:hypothetical protein
LDGCLYIVFAFEEDFLPVNRGFHCLTFSFYMRVKLIKPIPKVMLKQLSL